jgi:hypothetical protein
MGGLLVGGLLLKTVGWRVLAVSGIIFSSSNHRLVHF